MAEKPYKSEACADIAAEIARHQHLADGKRAAAEQLLSEAKGIRKTNGNKPKILDTLAKARRAANEALKHENEIEQLEVQANERACRIK